MGATGARARRAPGHAHVAAALPVGSQHSALPGFHVPQLVGLSLIPSISVSTVAEQAQALLKQAYQLKNSRSTTAPDRIIAAANELIGALHIVGRLDAVESIMRLMGSVKDWCAAHERELKMKR